MKWKQAQIAGERNKHVAILFGDCEYKKDGKKWKGEKLRAVDEGGGDEKETTAGTTIRFECPPL